MSGWIKVEDRIPPIGDFNRHHFYQKHYPVRVRNWNPDNWIQARFLAIKTGDEISTSWNGVGMNNDLDVSEWYDLPDVQP